MTFRKTLETLLTILTSVIAALRRSGFA